MKKAIRIFIIVVVIVVAAIIIIKQKNKSKTVTEYQFTRLKRGNIENLVSCTGTLNPLSEVEVGTQISGTVEQVMADFNDEVTKGQVLAILDQRQLEVNYNQAEANLEKAQSNFKYLKKIYENNQLLWEREMIAELELEKSKNDMISAKSSLISAESNLENARLDLEEYSIIKSPINGIVISRDVEPGQTVAASLSAPVLFQIAEDLAFMEIYALVDESDIGMIKEGMEAICTVDAFPEEEFTGIVKEVRLEPEVISNVVTYTVIVEAANRDDLLLPGMTANIDFIVEYREDVLTIENTALSFNPPVEVLEAMREKMMKSRPEKGDRKSESERMNPGQRMPNGANRGMPSDMGKLWYKDDEGNFMISIVKIGATDGVKTEILNLGRLSEDAEIVLKSNSNGNTNSNSSRNHMPGRPLF